MPTQLFERSRGGENALLIQPHAGGPPGEGVVEEFAELARSAGALVAASLLAIVFTILSKISFIQSKSKQSTSLLLVSKLRS